MAVAVLLVNFRVYDELDRTLTALAPLVDASDEVIVVDQASDPAALAALAGRHPRVRTDPQSDNRGFAAGVNRAARLTTAPYLLLLNPDACPEGPVVRVLEAWLIDHPNVAVAGPRVLDDDGRVQASARRFPGPSTALGGRSTWLTRRWPENPLSRRNLPGRDTAHPIDVDWVAGSCLMTRRDVFDRLGGFDESFFLYWEDADYCRRARALGYRCAYVPLVVVRHTGGRSAAQNPRGAARAFHASAFRLYWKHSGPLARLAAPVVGALLWLRGEIVGAVGASRGANVAAGALVIVVIGAGVVGLAIARAMARRGRAVSVIERHGRPGLETSTHNSGVIHAGLYYPAGSLKARLCVEGRERLFAFCREARVPHARCGKLLVAQADELEDLSRVAASAAVAGAVVEPVDRAFIARREPHVRGYAGLWSPDTGWVEAEALIRALEADVLRHEGVVLPATPVIGIEPRAHGLVVVTPRERIDADLVVNAAGLYADDVSRLADGESFRIYPCRGEYAELAPAARHLMNGLVYPVPHPSGHSLGVHFTRTLSGAVWIGPTARFQDDKQDYERDRLPLDAFLEPTRALLPAITIADLRLGGSGIRPKLHPPSERFADFLIRRDARNPYLVHAAGIESPGLTACLAIAEMVAAL